MPWSKNVFLHTADPDLRKVLAPAIEAAGGVLQTGQAAPPQSTGLLVLDVSITAVELANLASSARGRDGSIPILFVSATDSFDLRLKALRAGGAAFFARPIDHLVFGEKVRDLLRLPAEQAYRALIIDDDPASTSLSEYHLKSADFEVQVAHSATDGYASVQTFTPDVVMLDINMPGVDGLEFLGILRQQPSLGATQVVLVSNDASLSAQIDAMSHGAQNYLVKPVRAHDLVGVAVNNAARARAIRNLASRDPLTRVFNYGHIHDLAAREFVRHKRSGKDLAIAILDLDDFKQVNGQHGRPAGDAALQHFASQLQRILRRSDCVGRSGGDRFMLLLPDTCQIGASALIDKLRERMPVFAFEDSAIPLTFTCGIATAQARDRPHTAIADAECALRDAKRRGSNLTALA